MRRSLRAVTALVLREMSTRYGRSGGGYIWAVLEPVGAIVVIAVALSFIVRVPSLGNSFLLFYASGYLVFYLYNTLQTNISQALVFSRPLLMYPAVSWIDAILARFLLNLLTSIFVFFVILAGVLWFTEQSMRLEVAPMMMGIILMALLGLGHETLNCVLIGLFPAWAQLWGIASRPILILSGVFFIMEDLPDSVQDIVWWTPWIHVSSLFRSGIYPNYKPDFVSVTFVLIWAIVPLAMGLLLLRRYRQRILMQ